MSVFPGGSIINAYLKKVKSRQPYFELAPLLDVIFILLIFFAVSTTLILNNYGINLQLPSADSVEEQKKSIVLSIDAEQRLFINKTSLSLNELQDNIRSLLDQNPDLQLLLDADKLTPYEVVIQVLDHVRLAGCYDIVLEVQKNLHETITP